MSVFVRVYLKIVLMSHVASRQEQKFLFLSRLPLGGAWGNVVVKALRY